MAIVTQRTASMLFYGNIVVRISPKLFYSNSSLYIQYPTQAPRFTLWSQQFVYQVAVCLFDSGPLLQKGCCRKGSRRSEHVLEYLPYTVSDCSEKEVKYFMCLSSTHI